MFCPQCSHDVFRVVDVYRERRLKDGKWIIDNNCDTRRLLCRRCKSIFLTESKIVFAELLNTTLSCHPKQIQKSMFEA